MIRFHSFFQGVLLEVFTAATKLSDSEYLQQGGGFLHYVYCFCSNLKQVDGSANLLSRNISERISCQKIAQCVFTVKKYLSVYLLSKISQCEFTVKNISV
jgi:hypothetical protein